MWRSSRFFWKGGDAYPPSDVVMLVGSQMIVELSSTVKVTSWMPSVYSTSKALPRSIGARTRVTHGCQASGDAEDCVRAVIW